jgi:hypothetical protein
MISFAQTFERQVFVHREYAGLHSDTIRCGNPTLENAFREALTMHPEKFEGWKVIVIDTWIFYGPGNESNIDTCD